jgi:hypothetical protein
MIRTLTLLFLQQHSPDKTFGQSVVIVSDVWRAQWRKQVQSISKHRSALLSNWATRFKFKTDFSGGIIKSLFFISRNVITLLSGLASQSATLRRRVSPARNDVVSTVEVTEHGKWTSIVLNPTTSLCRVALVRKYAGRMKLWLFCSVSCYCLMEGMEIIAYCAAKRHWSSIEWLLCWMTFPVFFFF